MTQKFPHNQHNSTQYNIAVVKTCYIFLDDIICKHKTRLYDLVKLRNIAMISIFVLSWANNNDSVLFSIRVLMWADMPTSLTVEIIPPYKEDVKYRFMC